MNRTASCGIGADGEIPARYAALTLPPGEAETFEAHLLGCPECQAAVREAAAIGVSIRSFRSSPGRARRRRLVPAVLVAAAAIAVIALLPGDDAWRRLGAVTPPPFSGQPLRSAGDSAAEAGMAAYQRGEYRAAARLLATAQASERRPAIAFYRGLSLLGAHQPDSAIAVLSAVDGDPVYAPEAHYYMAKAWLQLGRPDSARAHARASAAGGPLLDSIMAAER